jgi:glycosyltransferase involved in cell wall biosynthesis
MPVYNGEKYIRDALDSLLSQTFSDFELIISDNASIDRTEEICREYAVRDSRISYYRQLENIGAAANFKFVLEKARCDYFMWAAYDDTWSKNLLNESVTIFADKSIDFVFPAFELKSIKLKVRKKISNEVFGFIECADKRLRVLEFIALHHNSHKCNIVYSLFRTKFLRKALELQDIDNDGALGCVVLCLGRGQLLNAALFSKRYPVFWPGSLNFILHIFHRNQSPSFDTAKEFALKRLCVLFPNYKGAIKEIFSKYRPYSHEKNYQICSVETLENNLDISDASK